MAWRKTWKLKEARGIIVALNEVWMKRHSLQEILLIFSVLDFKNRFCKAMLSVILSGIQDIKTICNQKILI